ncbi:MAG: hypothetical protein HKN87_11275 [Saprospiraceae bacterium]|nr:hypothetical protein [Saprospiraceae bacterium]
MPNSRFIKTALLLLLGSLTSAVVAQKALQLEKRGSLKTEKYFVGELLIYKLKSDKKVWLEEYMRNISIEDGVIFFEHRTVHIDSIHAIQIRNARQGVKTIAGALTGFSYVWNFWTLVSFAYGEPLRLGTSIVGLGSFVMGQGLKLAFFKTHKIKGRKRLRLIDLTFQ